jgi:hypothetical protein
MTGIGRSTDGLDPQAPGSQARGAEAPNPQTSVSARDVRRGSPRMHALLESLTHSLDLACRGYLCAPLVDCDPMTDPECGPTGKKVQFPEPASRAEEQILGAASPNLTEGVRMPRTVLEESLHEGLPGK